ncbi:hypothetical protein DB30_04935 [Enhygromyxa salina]|uniref:Uncharacterized protein n=1 Tax=Enhygromyxa salina TaxID=215803 RepID=A0A0C1ZXU5_9BACT|nr:DUF4215 domain-containing protein [Enhygromyxa salina]KIG16063.1 hypothetical protein DB30_04935 [Enhygromyxa salina]
MLSAALLGFVPTPAQAYCVTALDMAEFWSSEFPDLRVPVWLNISAGHSVAHMDQTPQDVARLVIEVLARHNESVAAPKLYFAGFTTEKYDPGAQLPGIPEERLPAGINIISMSCEEAVQQPLCSEGAKACARFVSRPKVGEVEDWNDPIGMVAVIPPGCDDANNDSLLMTGYVDPGQLLLHEIGHTLGLHHANQSASACTQSSLVPGGLKTGANGVMQTAVPASFAAFRSWRRDDLEALDQLYGAATGPLEPVWWDDVNYPDYPLETDATSLVGMSVSRSVVVSNRTPAGVQALASTNPEGRVIHQLMDELGELTPGPVDAVVDPGPSGRTWAAPAVAMGSDGVTDRVFVAWMANEQPDTTLMTLRTATRGSNSLDWTYSNHPGDFRVNRLSAAYVPGLRGFIVTTLEPATTEIQVVLFDLDGAALGPVTKLAGLHAFGVGAPLCTETDCLVPFSESAFGGPDFGVAEIQIDPRTGTLSVLSTEVLHAVSTYGGLSLLNDGQALLGGTGDRRFLLGSYPGLAPDGAEGAPNPNGDWPLGVGLWAGVNEPQRRIFQPRRVVCGNGIVQGAEACDDSNDVPGDGCDACALEGDYPNAEDPSESGSGDDGTAGETGGAGLDGADGCECRASRQGNSWLGWWSVLGLLALCRRRSERRHTTT